MSNNFTIKLALILFLAIPVSTFGNQISTASSYALSYSLFSSVLQPPKQLTSGSSDAVIAKYDIYTREDIIAARAANLNVEAYSVKTGKPVNGFLPGNKLYSEYIIVKGD